MNPGSPSVPEIVNSFVFERSNISRATTFVEKSSSVTTAVPTVCGVEIVNVAFSPHA